MSATPPGPAPRATPAASDPAYARGVGIVGLGGLVLSFDIPLIRLSESAFWTVLFVRGTLTFCAAALVWWLDRRRTGRRAPMIAGRTGLAITAIYSLAGGTFIFSVFNTSAGNVVFILAFNPMFAAILSLVFMGEVPSRATLVAIPATLVGVLLIIGAGLETGHWFGDLAALATGFLTALALTISRKSRTDMRYTAALGVFVPGLVALPFVASQGLQSGALGWLVLNGALVIPTAMICLAAAPMFVPSPVVAMGYLIETTLAPVWVWIVFKERPSDIALVGGVIVIVTLVLHSIAELRRVRNGRVQVERERPFSSDMVDRSGNS